MRRPPSDAHAFAWAREERSPSSPPTVRGSSAWGQTRSHRSAPGAQPSGAELPQNNTESVPRTPERHLHPSGITLGDQYPSIKAQSRASVSIEAPRRSLDQLWSSPASPRPDNDTPWLARGQNRIVDGERVIHRGRRRSSGCTTGAKARTLSDGTHLFSYTACGQGCGQVPSRVLARGGERR